MPWAPPEPQSCFWAILDISPVYSPQLVVEHQPTHFSKAADLCKTTGPIFCFQAHVSTEFSILKCSSLGRRWVELAIGPLALISNTFLRSSTFGSRKSFWHSLFISSRSLTSPLKIPEILIAGCVSTKLMRFALLSNVACLLIVVVAQTTPTANPPKIPIGFMATAGQPTTFQWTPTTAGTVTLTLRSGAASDLNKGTIIQCKSVFASIIKKKLHSVCSEYTQFRFRNIHDPSEHHSQQRLYY